MAIYHCSIKTISRGKSQSAVAAAAYRAGEKIYNEYDGRTSDYTRKKGIAHTEIMLPDNAPAEYKDRAVLWNAVERVETAKNSQLAREIQIALPVELSEMQNINLVREYIKKNFVEHGMCADITIHDKNDGNPHAHIMLTMRPLNEDKTWGDKQKKVYILDDNGEKIYDPIKRQYKCGKEQTTDWNEQTKAEEWRESWADIQNQHLEKHGFDVRVDHRSNERQGKEEIPTIHLGVAAHQMEQRGIPTERGDINRAIKKANEEIQNINVTILKLESELQQLINEQQQEEQQQAQQKQDIATTDIPTPTQKTTQTDIAKADTAKADSVKKPTVPTTTPSTPQAKPKSAQSTKAETQNKPVQNPKATAPTKPAQSSKTLTHTKPTPKPRTLAIVDKEIDIVETKLQRLEHASSVIMSYNYKIQDIERNLNSVGWWERRKMLKEISTEEQRRDSYEADTTKKYGTKPQLEKQKSKLLAEKKQIEDSTGITAAKERETQRKRDEVIRQHQERDRRIAERKAERLANPSKGRNEPSR